MNVQVVRKEKHGEFLFVEAHADFVNLLTSVQHLPIGALAKLASNHNAFATLQDSCSKLSNHVFAVPKNDALVSDKTIDVNMVVSGKQEMPIVPKLQRRNMKCTGKGNGPFTCTGQSAYSGNCNNAVAFRNLGSDFEIAVTLPSNYSSMMMGILPDDSSLESKLNIENLYNRYGCFLQNSRNGTTYPRGEYNDNIFNRGNPSAGNELRMRFQRQPQKLEFSYNGDGWHRISNPNGNSINEGTACCPVMISYQNDPITIKEVKSLSSASNDNAKAFFKNESTFLVTNELKVLDSGSFSSHLHLLQTYQISNILTLDTKSATFGPLEFRKLIAAIFDGKRNVLAAALGDDDHEGMLSSAHGNPTVESASPPTKMVDIIDNVSNNVNHGSTATDDWTGAGDY